MKFHLKSDFKPTGDQPQAIELLTENLKQDAKHQVLLGVTGSGKSVPYDTSVLIKDHKEQIKKVRIGKIADDIFSTFSKKIVLLDDSEAIFAKDLPVESQYYTFSFDPVTKKSSWKKIIQFVRHTSPDSLYNIQTRCGREVTVTGNHNFYAMRNGSFSLMETNELNLECLLPIPRYLEEPKNILHSINLLNYLPNDQKLFVALPNLFRDYEEYQTIFREHFSPSEMFGLRHGERITIQSYNKLSNKIPGLSHAVRIGIKAKDYQTNLSLPVTKNFMRLLGYYIAKGHSEKKYMILSSGTKEIIEDFSSTLKQMGLKYSLRYNTYDYQISSSFWSQLFTTWCGRDSRSKQLPAYWFNLSNKNLSALLNGYFSGDGGVDGDKVTALTASKQLADDISYALLRFGIVARIRKVNKKLPNSSKRNNYYQICISGQKFLNVFAEYIGFTITQKQNKLLSIIKPSYNTNTDLITFDGNWLKKVRRELNIYQAQVASACGIKRSFISLIEANKRNPSLDTSKKLLLFLEKMALRKNNTVLLKQVEEKQTFLSLYWSQIKTITIKPGEQYVYDFAVADTQTFLAGMGGIFVHNTFTMANTIRNIQRPTLIISHNKTLAGQLYQEFRDFFPDNAVSYFVSYYDYYQPEAYVPSTDTYIEKESEVNEEIDRLRLAATTNLLTRKDVIVVASVSCIYNLGSPVEYGKFILELKKGVKISQKDILIRLTDLQYGRNDYEFRRGTFRVRGNSIDLFPAYIENGIRIEVNEVITNMYEFDPLTGEQIRPIDATVIYPAKHYMTDPNSYHDAFEKINHDLEIRVKELRDQNKLIEAQRLAQRTQYDLEMIREVGFVNGIENYSIYFDKREPGSPPYSLIDYFKAASDEWLLIIDESHITIPQLRGMYNGDRARKQTLIDYGFRLPSALDNRPLKFEEFMRKTNQIIYVSATPNDYEISLAKEGTKNNTEPNATPTSDTLDTSNAFDTSTNIVEQLIRPTGLIDPIIEVKPSAGQIDDLMNEIRQRVEKKQRVLVTTLTKRMAEELTSYLQEHEIKVEYLHSDIETLNRQDVLDNLRLGAVDVVVGINLLREGLDLPEVSLVAILDADKEGFLRSRTSLIQTMGRAARNVDAKVIMYADRMTDSMKAAIDEGERRRKVQIAYNKKHGITPQTIQKAIRSKLVEQQPEEQKLQYEGVMQFAKKEVLLPDERDKALKLLRKEMKTAAERLDFETAIAIRDQIKRVQNK